MKVLHFSAVAALLAVLAQPAAALVEQSYLQWQENGDTVPNGNAVRVYARALKTGCTGMCDSTECADMTETFFYRAQGQGSFTSLPMTLNIGDCYTPMDEYFADIPVSALTGDSVFFYCEFADGDGAAEFTARPGSPMGTFNAVSPAYYLVQQATTENFVLHVTGDFHCVAPDGPGPGISGSFNGWNYQAMTPVGGGLYSTDIAWPAGSATTIEFKFRNGTAWESLSGGPFANREYTIDLGATEGSYMGYWNDQEVCPCIEHPLVAQQQVVFAVDMRNQDPASYSGGVSLQGSRAPLNWTAGGRPMNDFNHDGVYTLTVSFPIGTVNTSEYKFTRSNGTVWSWEDTPNRFLCMADNGFMLLDADLWNNWTPPVGTTVDVSVDFAVNMGCMSGVTGVAVQGSAAPLDWTGGSNALADGDADGVWTGTVVFPAGTAFDVEYKFTHTMDGTNWEWENGIANRALTLDDATPVVTLPTVAWDNFLCAPGLDITYTGGQAVLSWTAVPLAVSYNVYSSTSGYSTMTLEGSTTGTSLVLPATGMKVFQVRAVQ